METNLLQRFRYYVKNNSLFTKGDKILLAVSGGVDSMVMMSLFAEDGYEIGIAHCNFQLRGEESYEDEVLVEKEAVRYGVPFYNIRFDTAGEMERTGESVQIAARRLRYAWFDELSSRHGYSVIAIAHHADDSIETFFINMFRGTGLRGLTGINIINGRVVRPMLFATRKEIMDYAVINSIPYREDSSNRSTKYLRNKIRLGIVPRIKEINPKFPEIMGANLERLTDAQLFIDKGIEIIRGQVEENKDGLAVITPESIDPAFPKEFVIYELLAKYGFKGDVVRGLCVSLAEGQTGKRFYSKEYVAYADRGKIVVAPVTEEDVCEVEINKNARRAYCGNSVFYFEFMDIGALDDLKQPENIALLDADKLEFPLRARRWQDGDCFYPIGMKGRKKVSDYLIDEKVSGAEKQRQFVLLSGEDIVWLAGRRSDDRYKVTDDTDNVLKITKEII